MNILKSCKAWFLIAPGIWLPMFFGWVWVVVSWWIDFEFPSSGAILVCTSIIAQVVHVNWPYRIPESGQAVFIINSRNISEIPELEIFTKKSDFDEIGQWNYAKTAKRMDRVLVTSIIVSTVVGTMVWGYGHYLKANPPY